MGPCPDLWKATVELMDQIPEGTVSTFGLVAEALGDVRAARFVSLVVSSENRGSPWRVVRSDGRVGSGKASSREIQRKSKRLRSEGVEVRGDRVTDLGGRTFSDYTSSKPLDGLRRDQLRLRRRLSIPEQEVPASLIAGMDVAYKGDRAWAALVVIDAASGRVVNTRCVESEAPFPYIPSYLAYRELPVIEPLADELDPGTILMYDGNGILHPEGFGIASHAGVLLGLPTVGVAKRLICGSIGPMIDPGIEPVLVNGNVAGYSISSSQRSPIFASPGHGIGFAQTLDLTLRSRKHRLPEPVRLAHVLATKERRVASNK